MNADLATLSDTDPSSGSDTITLTAKDSFGNSAQQQTIAVTASGAAGADGAGVRRRLGSTRRRRSPG